jgi:hypothetical protein
MSGLNPFNDPPSPLRGASPPNGQQFEKLVPFSIVSHSAAGCYTALIATQGQVWFAHLTGDDPQNTEFVQLSGSAVGSPVGPVTSATAVCSGQPSPAITEAESSRRMRTTHFGSFAST